MTLAAQPQTVPADEPLSTEELRNRNRSLQLADRCDRCTAQAWVRVHLRSGGELQFCGHDFSTRELALLPITVHVHDERPRLVEEERRYR